MSENVIHAKIVAHKGFLVLELVSDRSIANQVVTSKDIEKASGQIVLDSAKHLGISSEASGLLMQVRPNGDKHHDDMHSFVNEETGLHVFGWPGTPNMIIRPGDIMGHKLFISSPPHQEIENIVPEGAKNFIDSLAG